MTDYTFQEETTREGRLKRLRFLIDKLQAEKEYPGKFKGLQIEEDDEGKFVWIKDDDELENTGIYALAEYDSAGEQCLLIQEAIYFIDELLEHYEKTRDGDNNVEKVRRVADFLVMTRKKNCGYTEAVTQKCWVCSRHYLSYNNQSYCDYHDFSVSPNGKCNDFEFPY